MNYNSILREFNEIGIQEDQALDQYQINHALDTIYQKNIKEGGLFNRDVSAEIFEQTSKKDSTLVILRNYINKIIQAQKLLAKFILQCQDKLPSLTNNEKQSQLQLLAQYEEDYHLLTATFKIAPLQSQHKQVLSKQGQQRAKKSNISSIFNQKDYEQSETLKIVFVLAIVSFFTEFFLMFVRQHFLNMMTYLAILSIFFLNYFDAIYIRLSTYLLAGSIFFDLMWMIAQADHYWNVGGSSHYYSQSVGFMRFVYIMTIILMVVKGGITFLLLKQRGNDGSVCKVVRLYRLRFELSASSTNPISQYFQQSKP